MNSSNPLGIYFHWPFCLSKCPYCDFNVHVRTPEDIDQERWSTAYLVSLEHYAQKTKGRVVDTVYFGGGTPSLMASRTAAQVIDKIHELWAVSKSVEITLEANPTSVETDRLGEFRDAGINRVSLGVQALNDADLKFLGREHSTAQAIDAIKTAQSLFERMSFDLIYARPEQGLDDWQAELSRAAELARGHLSLYQLTIERNTPFYFDHEQGKFHVPDEDKAADFYTLTQEVLEREGLPLYEVSNHAAPGQESRHNMIYWNYGDYIGIGPGAHGRLTLDGQKFATREHHAPSVWLGQVETRGSGAHPYQVLDAYERYTECLMMGLRLRDGLPFERLEAACDGDWDMYIEQDKLAQCYEQGWVIKSNQSLKLSQEGLLRLNALMSYLLKPKPTEAAA